MSALLLPPYPHFPRLIGERILLREVQAEDLDSLIEISFYDGVRAANAFEAAEMQVRIDANYVDGSSIHWCIVNAESGEVLGTCGYYRGFENASGELGCVLLAEHRGKGYMASALTLAIEFGLHTMGLDRIWALTTVQNTRAIALLKRLHFEKIAENGDEVEFMLRQT